MEQNNIGTLCLAGCFLEQLQEIDKAIGLQVECYKNASDNDRPAEKDALTTLSAFAVETVRVFAPGIEAISPEVMLYAGGLLGYCVEPLGWLTEVPDADKGALADTARAKWKARALAERAFGDALATLKQDIDAWNEYRTKREVLDSIKTAVQQKETHD